MGTNYYIRENYCTNENHCDACERHDEIHLGKSSYGWQFSFQYNEGKLYKNVEEMKEWTKGKQIWNEYDEEVSQKEFWDMVKEKQIPENHNHAEKVSQDYPYLRDREYVIDGYSFSDGEFS